MRIIITGNYMQFIHWCREQGLYARDPELIYPTHDLSNLRGVRANKITEIRYVGQWDMWGSSDKRVDLYAWCQQALKENPEIQLFIQDLS